MGENLEQSSAPSRPTDFSRPYSTAGRRPCKPGKVLCRVLFDRIPRKTWGGPQDALSVAPRSSSDGPLSPTGRLSRLAIRVGRSWCRESAPGPNKLERGRKSPLDRPLPAPEALPQERATWPGIDGSGRDGVGGPSEACGQSTSRQVPSVGRIIGDDRLDQNRGAPDGVSRCLNPGDSTRSPLPPSSLTEKMRRGTVSIAPGSPPGSPTCFGRSTVD